MSYYKDQLNRVDTKGDYNPKFKVTSEGGDTKWMDLNNESVKELREWLDENYPPVMVTLESVVDRKSYVCSTCPDRNTKEHCGECDYQYMNTETR